MTYLNREYLSLKESIDDAWIHTVSSSQFIGGSSVKQFELALAKYLEEPHVISCANGTDALLCSYLALGIGPDDEVIMPSFGYISAYEMCLLVGAQPILVDTDTFYHIDVRKVEEKVNSRTKAIVIQQLFGQSGDMQELMRIANKYNIPIIEDGAQAIGNKVQIDEKILMAGTIGTIGTFSFFPTKNLGCYGDGGALVTSDPELALKLRQITRHGQESKYNHIRLGMNSRLDALQAAILSQKLPHLDKWTERRREIAHIYDIAFNELNKINIPLTRSSQQHTYQQYTLKVNGRDDLKEYLTTKGIETIIYYPKPIHRQEIHIGSEALKRSESHSSTVLSIPISPFLTSEEISYVINCIIEWDQK